MADAPLVVHDNRDLLRYEIEINGAFAILQYRQRDDAIVLAHTEVPDAFRGRGFANLLARHALEEARSAGTRVVVRCPFVTSYIRRHPEYNALVETSNTDNDDQGR